MVRGEKGHRRAQLLALAGALERDRRDAGVEVVVIGEGRRDHGGRRDRVHRHPVRADLVHKVLERRVHSGAEDRRHRMARHRLLHAGRGDRHDAPPALVEQQRRQVAQHEERALELVVIGHFPARILGLGEEVTHRARRARRVQHEDVDAARRLDLFAEAAHVLLRGHVAGKALGPDAVRPGEPRGDLGQRVGIAGRQRQVDPFRRQRLGTGEPEPRGSSDDQCAFSRDSEIHSVCPPSAAPGAASAAARRVRFRPWEPPAPAPRSGSETRCETGRWRQECPRVAEPQDRRIGRSGGTCAAVP